MIYLFNVYKYYCFYLINITHLEEQHTVIKFFLNMNCVGKLYLSGRITDENADEYEVTIETLTCLFVLVYCDIEMDVYIVDTQENYICKVPLSVLGKSKTHFVCHTIKKCICDCYLPMIEVKDENICAAGVCTVLRWVIKSFVEVNPHHHSNGLLGFRGGCLVACTESSIWTKFCEIQLPSAVKDVATCIGNGSQCKSIPNNLFILEVHLNQPVRTHNILKRKLDIAKKAMQTQVGQNTADQKSNSIMEEDLFTLREVNKGNGGLNDIPERLKNMSITEKDDNFSLNHCYLEGIDLTLADMVVFPCVYYILCKLPPQALHLLPNVSKWYQKMIGNILVKSTADKCFSNINTEKNQTIEIDDVPVPEVDQVSLYKRDISRTRLRRKNFDPAQILSILEETEIHPLFSQSICTQLKWDDLPIELHPATGDLPKKRVARKCQQLESIITAILKVAKNGQTIVEFCAGGGHVGLLLAYYLPNCKIILIENKESSMMRARSRAKILELKNISFFQCNLDYFKGSFDIGISLHACGVATDLVIQQCISQQAGFVCCPCCYGGVQNTHLLTYPLSKKFQSSGVSYQDYTLLAHCADRNELNTATAEEGEYCMGMIDMDRVYNAEDNGYKVVLTTLQPPSCSPKHNLLIGTPLTWGELKSA